MMAYSRRNLHSGVDCCPVPAGSPSAAVAEEAPLPSSPLSRLHWERGCCYTLGHLRRLCGLFTNLKRRRLRTRGSGFDFRLRAVPRRRGGSGRMRRRRRRAACERGSPTTWAREAPRALAVSPPPALRLQSPPAPRPLGLPGPPWARQRSEGEKSSQIHKPTLRDGELLHGPRARAETRWPRARAPEQLSHAAKRAHAGMSSPREPHWRRRHFRATLLPTAPSQSEKAAPAEPRPEGGGAVAAAASGAAVDGAGGALQ